MRSRSLDKALPTERYLSAIAKLGEGRQPENQWTEVLAATLRWSPGLLQGFLALCGVIRPSALQWHVTTQQSRRGRRGLDILDLVLCAERGKRVVVEVKRGARLALQQLDRYRAHGGTLVALTERYPDVAPHILRQRQIRLVRWSDVHRLASVTRARTSSERFLLHELQLYLEESGVAHRPITLRDVSDLHRLLRELRAKLGLQVRGVSRAFATGQTILQQMGELRKELESLKPRGSKWSGPTVAGYTFGERGGGIGIGCAIDRGHRCLDMIFYFPSAGGRKRPSLDVGVWDRKSGDEVGHPKHYPLTSLMRQGALSWELVIQRCRTGIQAEAKYLISNR